MKDARFRQLSLIVLACALLGAAPASAAPVTVVDGDHVQRIDDPFTPSRAEVDLGPAPGAASRVEAHSSAAGARAVGRSLSRARARRAISASAYARYRRTYAGARATAGRLRGARRRELSYVVRAAERLALSGRLSASRMPVVFLQLRRNRDYWPSKRFPADRDQITFRGSEVVFQYFVGHGLQFHPLTNFKKANLLHGACTHSGRGKPVCGAKPPGPPGSAPCRPKRLRKLLDELSALAVRRSSRFIAWEYMFDFGGGSPPWISGMAQSTAIVALARAGKLLKEPKYDATARAALGAFETRRPLGVKTRGPRGGVHYLQYSFAPRLFIFNAFFQSLIGLYDYGRLTKDARGTALFKRAEPEARREVPYSSVGDWSRYSYRGRESTDVYHELLREVLQGLGRRLGVSGIYCDYAKRYRGFQTDPPRIVLSPPARAVRGHTVRVRFSLSKLSVVETKVTRTGKRVTGGLATMRRGKRTISWRPRSAGRYVVTVGAKELRTGRSKRGRASAVVVVR